MIDSVSAAARSALETAGARLVLEYAPALPPAEEAALLELVTTGGVPGGALTIPARPVDFRVTVESLPLPPAEEQALAEGVQVRLTLPAFPPHPSAGGTFVWFSGLYAPDGTLTGAVPLAGQLTGDGGYTVTVPAAALGGTAFLPVQVAPAG